MSDHFKKLDPLLHSRLRLAIMSILIARKKADFNFLKNKTESTSGNLSVQIDKLEKAGYLSVVKSFKGKRPHTLCAITSKGVIAFEKYVDAIQKYIQPDNS